MAPERITRPVPVSKVARPLEPEMTPEKVAEPDELRVMSSLLFKVTLVEIVLEPAAVTLTAASVALLLKARTDVPSVGEIR